LTFRREAVSAKERGRVPEVTIHGRRARLKPKKKVGED